MSKPDRKAILASIRSKYIGTADEHEALASLMEDYSSTYDSGFTAGQESQKWQNETDQRLLKLAFAYQEGCPIDAHFHEWLAEKEGGSYRGDWIGQRLHQMGVTRDMLAKVAEEYQKAAKATEGVQ